MKRLKCLLVAALLAVGPQPMAAPQITAPGEKLLVAARHKATVDGDLKGAIEEYRKIVAGAGASRALAARALVEMAECHQKLGDTEASKIYTQVLRDYADQAEAASIARARLAVAAPPSGTRGVVTRQVWTGLKVDFTGTVSSDGRHLSFVDWSTGNLHLRDLTAGRDQAITTEATWYENPIQFAQESVISPDGRQIAYAWQKGMRFELRVSATSGNAPPPRVLVADDTMASLHPYAWSPDGRWIAAQFRRTDNSAHIALVSASDGALRILRSGTTTSLRLFFSPDGAYLAFDLPSQTSARERDVFVLPADGGPEIPAVVHPGTDFAAGWAPDGRSLLFASDRAGSKGLWRLGWSNGKPSGEPELLKSDMSLAAPPLGMTRAGALYYGLTLSSREIVVAGIDTGTGAVASPPVRPIDRYVGSNTSPDWSPDGRSLAYLSTGRGVVLAIREMATGQTRELRPALSRINSPRWAPDGRSLAVLGGDVNGRHGIYRIDASTGDAAMLVDIPQRYAPYLHDWTPDGRTLVYRVIDAKGHVAVQHDLESGKTRELTRGGIATMRLSPDGRSLAMAGDSGLALLSLETGKVRPLAVQGIEWPMMVMAWTPDSRKLLVYTPHEPVDAPRVKGDLWLVSVADGARRKLDLDLEVTGPPGARFNPKTNQLAITVDETRREVWMVDNFLPAAKPSPERRP